MSCFPGESRFARSGRIVQSIKSPTADPGVTSLTQTRSHTIDHEIISTVIFLPLIQEGLLSVKSESMCRKYWVTAQSGLPRKKCGLVN